MWNNNIDARANLFAAFSDLPRKVLHQFETLRAVPESSLENRIITIHRLEHLIEIHEDPRVTRVERALVYSQVDRCYLHVLPMPALSP